jgi:anti-anti-sigma factor
MSGQIRDEQLVDVHLLGIDLDVQQRSTEHHDALRREFALLAADDESPASVPARLTALSEELDTRFSGFTESADAAIRDAIERGDATIDLTLRLPADAAEASIRMGAMLDEADEYCRQGEHLLTLAPPEDLAAFRRWVLDETVGQIGGAAPTPWSRARHSGAGASPATPPPSDGSHRIALPTELDLEVAPRLRQELNDVIAAGGRDLVLDGAGVEFIDSVGISVLMAAMVRCQAAGGRLVVVDPSPRLRTTLEIIGVDQILL